MTFHDIPLAKTYGITVLVAAAMRVVPEFSDHLGTTELPTPEEFEETLTAAQDPYTFVLSTRPAASHP